MIPYHHLRSVFLFVFVSAYTLPAGISTDGAYLETEDTANAALLTCPATAASVAAADNTPSSTPFTIDNKILLSAGSGLAGIGAGIAGIVYARKASVDYDSSGMHFSSKSIEDRYYRHYRKHYTYSSIAFVGSGIGFLAAAYFYFVHFDLFGYRQTSLIPYYNPDGEIGLTMKLRW